MHEIKKSQKKKTKYSLILDKLADGQHGGRNSFMILICERYLSFCGLFVESNKKRNQAQCVRRFPTVTQLILDSIMNRDQMTIKEMVKDYSNLNIML